MRTIGRRDSSTNDNKRRKIRVDILGRGSESITVSPHNTVGDLRRSLNIGGNVRAVDNQGNRLEDTSKIYKENEVNFVPNVKGGKE